MNRRGDPSAFVISITPFDAQGEVDFGALRAHFARLAESGVGVYVGGGGSGEGHALLDREVDRLLEIAVEELAGKVPTRAMGVEPRTARQMIEFGRRVKGTGLDAMQIYSLDMGHLGIPRPQELDAYFREVLEAVDMPSVVSTHFSVGYMVPVDLLLLCATSTRRSSASIARSARTSVTSSACWTRSTRVSRCTSVGPCTRCRPWRWAAPATSRPRATSCPGS